MPQALLPMFLFGAVKYLLPFFAFLGPIVWFFQLVPKLRKMAIIPSSILGLGTEVRVWSQFFIFFDWRISNVESADRTVKLLLQIWRELTLSRARELDSSKVCQTSSTVQLDFVLVLTS